MTVIISEHLDRLWSQKSLVHHQSPGVEPKSFQLDNLFHASMLLYLYVQHALFVSCPVVLLSELGSLLRRLANSWDRSLFSLWRLDCITPYIHPNNQLATIPTLEYKYSPLRSTGRFQYIEYHDTQKHLIFTYIKVT